mgnify:CR=1 FL=1
MGKKDGKDKANGGGTIALNKRARHEYHFEEKFEAGLALQGWELKSIRAGRANITESYAVVRNGELFLFGAQITPLISASTHVVADDRRTHAVTRGDLENALHACMEGAARLRESGDRSDLSGLILHADAVVDIARTLSAERGDPGSADVLACATAARASK